MITCCELGSRLNCGSQTTDKAIWHASIQPSPAEGKGDRERSEAVEEVVEVLNFTKFFELNSGHHLTHRFARDCVGVLAVPPPPSWGGLAWSVSTISFMPHPSRFRHGSSFYFLTNQKLPFRRSPQGSRLEADKTILKIETVVTKMVTTVFPLCFGILGVKIRCSL